MQNGIYSVSFSSGVGSGGGVAVVEDGKIQGGDASFIYKGRYEKSGNNVTANVEVSQHRAGQSVLGMSGTFRLALTGMVNGDQFTLGGGVPGQPSSRITMAGSRKSDLVS